MSTNDPFPSVAPVVQRRYRLRPEDLVEGPVEATIVNISMEGLETLRPVLHFDSVAKPLVLTPGTANQLARVSGTAIMDEWIGLRIKLASTDSDDGLKLNILSPTEDVVKPLHITRPSREARRQRARTFLIALLLLLIFLAVFLLEDAALTTSILELIFGPS